MLAHTNIISTTNILIGIEEQNQNKVNPPLSKFRIDTTIEIFNPKEISITEEEE